MARNAHYARKAQIEIPGTTNELEIALDDLSDRLDDLEKDKESIGPAKDKLSEVMMACRKDKIFHRGRNFSISSPEIKPKLRITKQKES